MLGSEKIYFRLSILGTMFFGQQFDEFWNINYFLNKNPTLK